MSTPSQTNSQPLENKNQLIELLEAGCKPKSNWKIGTELEMFGFALPNSEYPAFSSPPYAPNGIEALLKKYKGKNWNPIYDEGEQRPLIALIGKGDEAGKSISLEPAGQFELSGAPLSDLFQTEVELSEHFKRVHLYAEELGYGFSPLGFHPLWRREVMPWMPKARYKIMRQHLPLFGNRGDIDTLKRTCTVQVNLDFSSESDMRLKMQLALLLQPVATAIFANSPFIEGKLSEHQSLRGQAWVATDTAWTGQADCLLDSGFCFESYVDYVLKAPMCFIRRDGQSIDAVGNSFLEWMNGKGEGELSEYQPTLGDFEDLLTTIYPDVRLKTYLEMRGADAGCPEMMVALPAFWTGLLYDQDVLEELNRLVLSYPREAYRNLYFSVPKEGIRAFFPGGFQNFLKCLCNLAEKGLQTRKKGEEKFLDPIKKIIESGRSQSDYWVDRFKTAWEGDVSQIFLESFV